MSLTLIGIAALTAAASRSHNTYLLGCDAIGSLDEGPDLRVPTVVKVYQGNYWTSVVAGLTVATILGMFGYGLQRVRR